MNKRTTKATLLTVMSLFTLTSCNAFTSLLDRIMGTVLVNVAMNLPILVNGIDVIPDFNTDNEPALMEWENPPTTNQARVELDYVKNILIVPESLSATLPFINQTFTVNFTTEITIGEEEDGIEYFHHMSLGQEDLPEGFDLSLDDLPFSIDFRLGVYIPIGESDLLDDIDTFEALTDLVNEDGIMSDIAEAVNQEPREITFKVSAASGQTSKSKNFYFRLVKPEIGTILFDQIFSLDELMHTFKYDLNVTEDNIMEHLHAITDKPTNVESPASLTYFKKSLIIPKQIETVDFGVVNISYDVTYISDNPPTHLLKETTMTRPVSEFADNEFITGDITVAALTPVGTYYDKLDGIDEVTELQDHFTADDAPKELYRHTFQEDVTFALDLTISTEDFGEETRTYYFNVDRPLFDQEIVDEVIKQNVLINKVNYKDVESGNFSLSTYLPTDPSNAVPLEYLVDTLAIPSSVKLNEYLDPNDKPKEIFFDIEFEDPEMEDYFFNSTKSITGEDNPDYDEFDVTLETFTPLGDLEADEYANDSLEQFADKIVTMASEDTKRLYQAVSADEKTFSINITARTEDEHQVTTAEATDTFYFKLLPANVDGDIISYVEKEDSLLSVINYEDIEEGNDDGAIRMIANEAKDSDHPYNNLNHFTDTLIIPTNIKVDGFEGKELRIFPHSTPINGTGDDIETFSAVKESTIDGNEITAETLTSLGGYDALEDGVDDGDLEGLADNLKTLSAKKWYDYSQVDRLDLRIDLTIEIWSDDGTGTYVKGEETSDVSFYVSFSKPNIDKKIGEAILGENILGKEYKLVNYIDHDSPLVTRGEPNQPKLQNDPEPLLYFNTSLVFPETFTFDDFGSKRVIFSYDFKDESGADANDYMFSTLREFDYEEQVIVGKSFTPIGGYEINEPIDDFAGLVAHFSANYPTILVQSQNEPIRNLVLTVTITIETLDENDNVITTYDHTGYSTYYFDLVPDL